MNSLGTAETQKIAAQVMEAGQPRRMGRGEKLNKKIPRSNISLYRPRVRLIISRQLRYIDIFDKYRYFKNIDIQYSIFRISKISKVVTKQLNLRLFGNYCFHR